MNKIRTAKNLLWKCDFHGIKKRVLKNILGDKFRDYDFRQLVDEKEIKPKFEESLLYLKNYYKSSEFLGDYLEFGVSHGSSMFIMFETINEMNLDKMRLFGFDSFEGLPDLASTDDNGHWRPGDYYAKEKNTRQFLTKSGIDWNKVKLIKGWFKDTLRTDFIEQNNIEKASIIMIDCDLYSAAKQALKFCASLIKDQTIIFFDDWNAGDLASRNLGEKKAFDEFMEENPQFESKDFGSYSFKSEQNGVIKLVSLKQSVLQNK